MEISGTGRCNWHWSEPREPGRYLMNLFGEFGRGSRTRCKHPWTNESWTLENISQTPSIVRPQKQQINVFHNGSLCSDGYRSRTCYRVSRNVFLFSQTFWFYIEMKINSFSRRERFSANSSIPWEEVLILSWQNALGNADLINNLRKTGIVLWPSSENKIRYQRCERKD